MQANDLELSDLEEELYLGLLEDRWKTTDDFANHVAFDEGAAIRSVDRLVALGLVTSEEKRRTLPPQVRYAQLIAEAEVELQRNQVGLARAKRSLATLAAEQNQLGARESLTSLSPIEVRARLRELVASARNDVLSLHAGNAHQLEVMQASLPLNESVLTSGVSIRCLYQTSIGNDPRSVEYGRGMLAHGADVRTVAVIPQQMIVIDQAIALIPIDPSNPGAGALEVQHPSVLSTFVAMFEQLWNGAAPLGTPHTEDDLGLSTQERELLSLFAHGHCDQSAAHALAVSLRTVRRMVAALSERLSVRGRYALGVRAAQLGLVGAPHRQRLSSEAEGLVMETVARSLQE